VCFNANNRDVETLKLLAQVFRSQEQVSKTVSVLRELAKIHGEEGLEQEAQAAWQQLLALAPEDKEAQRAVGLVPTAAEITGIHEASRPEPSFVGALPPAAVPSHSVMMPLSGRFSEAPSSPGSSLLGRPAAPKGRGTPPRMPQTDRVQITKLMAETDVYVKWGFRDKAIEHVKKVFGLDPVNLDAHDKLRGLLIQANDVAGAAQEVVTCFNICLERGERPKARQYLSALTSISPTHPQIPAMRQGLDGVTTAAPHTIHVTRRAQPTAATLTPGSTAVPDEVALVVESGEGTGTHEFLVGAVGADEPFGQEAAGASFDPSQADLNLPSLPAEEFEEVSSSAFELALPADEAEAALFPGENAFVSPGAFGAAPSTLMLDRQDVEAAVRAARMGQEHTPQPEASPSGHLAGLPDALPPDQGLGNLPSPTPDMALDFFPDELAEAAFFIRQGLFDEARELLHGVLAEVPDSSRATWMIHSANALERGEEPPSEPLAPPPDPTALHAPRSAAPESAFSLAQELADELSDAAADLPSVGQEQVSVETVLAAFREDVDRVVSQDDADTHHDLGIAYREMGLLDDAMAEFERSSRNRRKEADAFYMVGLCRMERQQFAEAVEAFQRAHAAEVVTDNQRVAIHYELGRALHRSGRLWEALAAMRAVVSMDPSFKDAGEHVRAWESDAGGTGEGRNSQGAQRAAPVSPAGQKTDGGKKKSKNIGYI
jgi:tetratricopeptide (TPR) repeat protein